MAYLFFYNRMIYNIHKYKEEKPCSGTEQRTHSGTCGTPAGSYLGFGMTANE